jgi:hypothetical protein
MGKVITDIRAALTFFWMLRRVRHSGIGGTLKVDLGPAADDAGNETQ